MVKCVYVKRANAPREKFAQSLENVYKILHGLNFYLGVSDCMQDDSSFHVSVECHYVKARQWIYRYRLTT